METPSEPHPKKQCIEDLREKRELLDQQIMKEEGETQKQLILMREEYDKTILEFETGYAQVLQEAQGLLQVAKRENERQITLTKMKIVSSVSPLRS